MNMELTGISDVDDIIYKYVVAINLGNVHRELLSLYCPNKPLDFGIVCGQCNGNDMRVPRFLPEGGINRLFTNLQRDDTFLGISPTKCLHCGWIGHMYITSFHLDIYFPDLKRNAFSSPHYSKSSPNQ